jgi:predicted glycoside hydrolase/deacetylase ChbG (UPF0249 family)
MTTPFRKRRSNSIRAGDQPVRLIIRGDDAGVSESANRAIKLACQAGTLKNVSVMACGPAFEEAAAFLRETQSVCIGLHVTLNCEWPCSSWGPVSGAHRCASLVHPDGRFKATPYDHFCSNFCLKEAVFEVEAQLERLRSAGLTPVYLDEHMGVGWLPGLRKALATTAEREGLYDVDAVAFDRVQRKPDYLCDDAKSLMDLVHGGSADTHLHITHPDFTLTRDGWPGGMWNAKVRDADRRLLLHPHLLSDLRREGVELTTFAEAMERFRARSSATADANSVEKRIVVVQD